MERKISGAARRLGDNIQKIVMEAKLGKQSKRRMPGNGPSDGMESAGEEWSDRLLRLLGGSDAEKVQTIVDDKEPSKDNFGATVSRNNKVPSDVDILLECSKCDKFLLRCMENELPPNLIHCMRLLRVLELKNGASQPSSDNDDRVHEPRASLSKKATHNVEHLLCLLCRDASVGEQLRPHLFGLLALSGARYPINAVHISEAASNIIVAFSISCLSKSLIWFLHERKMIIHMLDDLKELCGISSVSSSTGPQSSCLNEKDAELHGLWINALSAIIHLVRQACSLNSIELLSDFVSAGGYHVLRHAIEHSSEANLKTYIQLSLSMMYCKLEANDDDDDNDDGLSIADSSTDGESHGGDRIQDETLVTNPRAFEVIDGLINQLLSNFLPLSRKEEEDYTYVAIDTRDDIRALAKNSLEMTLKILESNSHADPDKNSLTYEIIESIMQLYSDHPTNFSIIEGEYDVLAKFLLGFSSFEKPEVKQVILRTLEFSCTGLINADCWKPLSVASEVFLSICKYILRLALDENHEHDVKNVIEIFSADANLLGETLEKLLMVDEPSLGIIMIDAGIVGEVLQELLSLLMMATRKKSQCATMHIQQINNVYCGICRMINLIIHTTFGVSKAVSPRLDSPNKALYHSTPTKIRSVELDAFLVVGMTELSGLSCQAAVKVFETVIRFSETESLNEDVEKIISVLQSIANSIAEVEDETDRSDYISSACEILGMLMKVMGFIDSSHEVFLRQGGLEALIGLIYCLEKCISVDTRHSDVVISEPESSDDVMNILLAIYGVIDAAMSETRSSQVRTASKAVDLLGEDSNGTSKNREYLIARGFYESIVLAFKDIGLLTNEHYAIAIMNLSLGLLHRDLQIPMNGAKQHFLASIKSTHRLRNPDASRLVLGVSIALPEGDLFRMMSECALDLLIDLCSVERAGTTLGQIANSGICQTLVSNDSLSSIFDNVAHPLHSRFVALLHRVSSFKMSHMDFVTVLRFTGHPILTGTTGESKNCLEIKLPVIDSLFDRFSDKKMFGELEEKLKLRLQTLSLISKSCDRVSRCLLGGSNDLNESLLAYAVDECTGLDDKIYYMAEKGMTKFIKIDNLQARTKRAYGIDSPLPSANVWPPANTSGFSYSLWLRLPNAEDMNGGNICIFDISNNMDGTTDKKNSTGRQQFLSVWYDIAGQGFNVIYTGSTKAIRFPSSPLSYGEWHHILLTYQPPKRSVLTRKAVLGMCVDGKPLEVDVKIDALALPPTSTAYIGIPNPVLAISGKVTGKLPSWELGSTLLLSRILGPKDAVSIYSAGPEFHGQFWGDRPQRMSLSATATSMLSALAASGEYGGVDHSLEVRSVPEIEAASYAIKEKLLQDQKHRNVHVDIDTLSSVGLFFNISPEYIVFAFHPSSSTSVMREDSVAANKGHFSRRLVNVAEIHSTSNLISSDAIIHGEGSVVCPVSFGDNVQWLGGPKVLLPLLHASNTPSTIALTLRVLRQSAWRHIPNLEVLHSGGGYPIIALLLAMKEDIDSVILEHCFAFAIYGFEPRIPEEVHAETELETSSKVGTYFWRSSDDWAVIDLDALKHFLMNHQVWNLQSSGPDLTMRVLCLFNSLVRTTSKHYAFNARRLHLIGISKWTIHAMIEISELYTFGWIGTEINKDSSREVKITNETLHVVLSAYRSGWTTDTSSVSTVCVGGDPGVPILLACKSLLRQVLAHILTPDDIVDVAGSIIYTLKKESFHEDVAVQLGYDSLPNSGGNEKLTMGSVLRVYLLRLMEELIVDKIHVNPGLSRNYGFQSGPTNIQEISSHETSEQNTQMFLAAFAAVLSPVWFASLLEGCRDESSAAAAFRLLIIMIQNSTAFEKRFHQSGGFAPFILSIPKYSTSASITLAMLSQLMHAPLLNLPCFADLDAEQLCAVFDIESDFEESILQESKKGGIDIKVTPSNGIFSLIAECVGRNIQLGATGSKLGMKANKINQAVISLLIHMHSSSSSFQKFCGTPEFIVPLAQALCLVHNDQISSRGILSFNGPKPKVDTGDTSFLSPSKSQVRPRVESVMITDNFQGRGDDLKFNGAALHDESPTKLFVGEEESCGGIGLVHILRHVMNRSIKGSPKAVELIAALFRSYPVFSSPYEVEAFHMVLLEQCQVITQDTLQSGDAVAIANCVGISSFLFERMILGFFTSQTILQALRMTLSTLESVSNPKSNTYLTLKKEDPDGIVRISSAHWARLTCIIALHRSKTTASWGPGDEILQGKIIDLITCHIPLLLYTDITITAGQRKKNSTSFSPSPGTHSFLLWQSTSLRRCSVSSENCKYPDVSDLNEPDKAFIIAIMSEVPFYLQASKRQNLHNVFLLIKSLLENSSGFLSDLLSKDRILVGGGTKRIDFTSDEGFRNLFHIDASKSSENFGVDDKRIQIFFEWLEDNRNDINEVFGDLERKSQKSLPSIFEVVIPSPELAIDQEQKGIINTYYSGESEKAIVRSQERSNLVTLCNERIDISHDVWKRQGIDNLSSGAMMWKSLLKQLKGSRSLWEGKSHDSFIRPISKNEVLSPSSQTTVDIFQFSKSSRMRWKLDMTEGHERQRRKLSPNYEFFALYNIEENIDPAINKEYDLSTTQEHTPNDMDQLSSMTGLFMDPEGMVATADLLKKMDLSAIQVNSDDEADDEDIDEDIDININDMITMVNSKSLDSDQQSFDTLNDEDDIIEDFFLTEKQNNPSTESSNGFGSFELEDDFVQNQQNHYDLITGLLQAGDTPEKSYNVQRCTGLEVCTALLLRCKEAIYIIDGFEQSDGLKGKIRRVEKTTSTFQVGILAEGVNRQTSNECKENVAEKNDTDKKKVPTKVSSSDNARYQHKCKRLSYHDLYAVYRRRYQLQQIALEFYDTYSNGTFVAFRSNKEREEVLNILLHSNLPNSIFNVGSGTSPNYDKFMKTLRAKLTNQWVQGKMTNFEFLMHLNSFAGRTYNDLTQYPVFPWVIADYESEEIDLNNPNIYRDLSKPMGALGLARAEQFKERYEALESNYNRGDEPPAFHYGTHYSCAAYVLNYLLRLEPFSRLALSLQGGKFDLADRLFHNIGASWISASRDNLQDVRELIPEFFYLPEFLENSNSFDLGVKQDGTIVHDVVLPPWAKGDPRRFVRINRQVSLSLYFIADRFD
jgi:hypothetical protein